MDDKYILKKVAELRELVKISKERLLNEIELNKMSKLRTELFGY